MRKFEMAMHLAEQFGYSSYLELCTPTTGATFAEIRAEVFPQRVRAMYRCPADFADGLQIDLREPAETSEPLLLHLVQTGQRFDVVFLDSFHTYACTLRDLALGLQLVKDTGVMIVHDCSPPRGDWCTPEWIPGNWCGVTYAGFLDFVLPNPELSYITVDSDFGCGMVTKAASPLQLSRPDLASLPLAEWFALDLGRRYDLFDRHRVEFLQLTSVADFMGLVASCRDAGPFAGSRPARAC